MFHSRVGRLLVFRQYMVVNDLLWWLWYRPIQVPDWISPFLNKKKTKMVILIWNFGSGFYCSSQLKRIKRQSFCILLISRGIVPLEETKVYRKRLNRHTSTYWNSESRYCYNDWKTFQHVSLLINICFLFRFSFLWKCPSRCDGGYVQWSVFFPFFSDEAWKTLKTTERKIKQRGGHNLVPLNKKEQKKRANVENERKRRRRK